MNSLAPHSPIVRAIVMKAMRVELQHLQIKQKHVLNTDLIPKFSEKVVSYEDMEESLAHSEALVLPPLPKLPEDNISQHYTDTKTGMERLFMLINDKSITHIECFGSEIPLAIMRFGQKQKSNVSLSQEDIKSFLDYVSEKAKIPLIDGVFKVSIDNILINAIVSDAIGTKFMIRKNYQLPQQ